jgi:nucleotide-binding universal stress UspA family protein
MYERLLIPLDGSDQAATALPHGVTLARLSSARLQLIRVIDTIDTLVGDPSLQPDPASAETSQDAMASHRHNDELMEAQNVSRQGEA